MTQHSVRLVDLPFTSENALNLTNPNDVECQVWHYSVSISSLNLRVGLHNDFHNSKYIGFINVAYFSGPMYWIGANFRLIDTNKVIELMQKMEKFKHIPNNMLPLSLGGIESVNTNGLIVRIIAEAFAIKDHPINV